MLGLFSLLLAVSHSAVPTDLIITERIHHVRSGAEREWAEFPGQAEGTELIRTFQATPNTGEQKLRLRHRDLKQGWRVLVNVKEIARLPFDEADMITYWVVPAGTLRDGANELRIHCTGAASDDVLIGPVTLIDRPREQVLLEATVDVSVHEAPGGRAVPSRITVADEHATLVSPGNVSDAQHAVRPGVVYSGSGAVRLSLPAGRYVIYAGRGFEYSVARAEVELAQGTHASRSLTIRREVDTTGWAAMDTHVHTGAFAGHGDAAIEERMLTIAGEGVELPVSTEHNMRVDFDARSRGWRAGLFYAGHGERSDHAVARPFQRLSDSAGRQADRPAGTGLAPASRSDRECGNGPGDRPESRARCARRLSAVRSRAVYQRRWRRPRQLAAARQCDGGRQLRGRHE